MGLGIKTKLRSLLERKLNRQYADRLAGAKRRVTYEEWLRIQEGQNENAAGTGDPADPAEERIYGAQSLLMDPGLF